MIVQRHFALKGTAVLYVAKDKVDSLSESLWNDFKRQICGEGSIESFPHRIKESVEKNGWCVDEDA